MLLVQFGFVQYVLNNLTCMRELYRLVSLSSPHLEVHMRNPDLIGILRWSVFNSIDVSPTCEICGTFHHSEVGQNAFLSQGSHRQRPKEVGLRRMRPASP
jgi:hypothetical protein